MVPRHCLGARYCWSLAPSGGEDGVGGELWDIALQGMARLIGSPVDCCWCWQRPLAPHGQQGVVRRPRHCRCHAARRSALQGWLQGRTARRRQSALGKLSTHHAGTAEKHGSGGPRQRGPHPPAAQAPSPGRGKPIPPPPKQCLHVPQPSARAGNRACPRRTHHRNRRCRRWPSCQSHQQRSNSQQTWAAIVHHLSH
jgi:hypothetical protein